MPKTPQSNLPTRSPAKASTTKKTVPTKAVVAKASTAKTASPTKAVAAKKTVPTRSVLAKNVVSARATGAGKAVSTKAAKTVSTKAAKTAPANKTAAKKAAPAKVSRAAQVAPAAKAEGIRALLAKAAADLEGPARTAPASRIPSPAPAPISRIPAPTRVSASTPPPPVRAIAEPDAEPEPELIEAPDLAVPAPPPRSAALVDMDAIDRDLMTDRQPVAVYQAPAPVSRRSRKGLVAAAVVGILAIGGGAGAFVLISGDKPPSKAAYIADAEEICRPANAPVAAIVRPTSYPELAIAAGTYVTTTRGQLDQLRRLDQPGGDDRVSADAVIAALDGTVTAAQNLNDAATRADETATITATKEAKAAFSDASAKAASFGFGSCGTGLATGMEAVFGGSQTVVKVGFVAKAEAACRASVREIDEVAEPESPDDLDRFFADLKAVSVRLSAEFKKLAVPPGDEAIVAEIVTGIDKADSKGDELFDAIEAEDESRALALERELNSMTTALDAKLDAYGLAACGSNYGFE